MQFAQLSRPLTWVLVCLALLVGLACGGEAATPTSPPTATSPPPTATSPPPTATSPTVAEVAPTEVPVPEADVSADVYDAAANLMKLPGYKPEWGEPKYGGTLVMSGPASSVAFYQMVNMGWSYFAYMQIFNSLVKYDPWVGMSGAIHPELAKSWEISGDGLEITFHLREGVKFHPANSPNGEWAIPKGAPESAYGSELHCDDVKATIEFAAAPPEDAHSLYNPVSRGYDFIAGASCPDGPLGYIAVIELSRVTGYMMLPFTGGSFGMGSIFNKEYLEWLWASEYHYTGRTENPDGHFNKFGTGAFMPDEVQDGVMAGTMANPDYFKEGLPFVDRLEGWSITDATTRYSAWITGKIHWFGGGSSGMTPAIVERTQKDNPEYKIYPSLYQLQGVHLNTLRPPFDNPKVRQAFHLAADREIWREMKKSGTLEGTYLADVIPPYSPYGFTEEELKTWPGFRQPKTEDIAEANRLLDEVYGEGERPGPWVCMTREVPTYRDYCVYAVQQIQQNLGIEATMEILDGAAANQRRNSCEFMMDADSAFDVNTTLDPTPRLRGFAHSEGGATQCELVSQDPAIQGEIDRRIVEQDRELDPLKRKELTRALSKELTIEYVPYLIEGHVVTFLGYRPEVKGALFFFEGGQGHQWSNPERTWLAD